MPKKKLTKRELNKIKLETSIGIKINRKKPKKLLVLLGSINYQSYISIDDWGGCESKSLPAW